MKTLIILSVIYLTVNVFAMNNEAPPKEVEGRKVVLNPSTGQLFYTGQSYSHGKTCDRNCEDKMKYCHFPGMGNMCKGNLRILFALKCPKTCGLCTPCNYQAGACSDDCKDAQPKKCQFLAPTMCKHPSWGHTVQKYCERSCGICIECGGLKPVPDCSRDCADEDRQCRAWANEKNYCAPDSQYRQWMLNNCKQSCGVCRHCDGEAPPGATKPTYKPTRTPFSTRTSYTTPSHGGGDYMCRKKIRRGGSVAEQCLAAHNYYRCLHGVEDLEYDYRLEDSAKAYVNTLPTRPSKPGVDRERDTGENWAVLDSVRDGVEEAVDMWYAEGLGYDYQQEELIHRDTEKFTQLIWSDTTRVGCAIRRYRSQTYVVAHYFAIGNEEAIAFNNIFEPILDVCSATRCTAGYCQGHDNTHDCECEDDRYGRDRRDTVPMCSGNCVVKCPEPRHNRDEWVETCAGTRSCTCVTSGSGVLGARCQ